MAPKYISLPENPLTLTSHCVFLVLNCLRNLNSPEKSFIERLREYPLLKTSSGFVCSPASVLYEPTWACLLNVANIPLIDYNFYGNELSSYKDELKVLGVAVEFTDVLNKVISHLKINLLSLTLNEAPSHLIALLRCVAKMKETMQSELDYMCQLLSEEEILKTRHGFKRPKASILFNSKWASISQFVDLPLIDDSYYGIAIYSLRDELKTLGVLSSLKDGATFVAVGLTKPIDKDLLTAEGTLSLLYCLREMMADGHDNPCIKAFVENLKKSEFLKTSRGYRLPEDCFVFHGDWRDMLDPEDAPFLDDKYYGLDMTFYLHELKAIGVKLDPMDVCSTLFQSLPELDETLPIKRTYGFLKAFQWKPEPQNHAISENECCFFWTYVLKNWDEEMEDALKKNMVKVPTNLPEGGKLLVSKEQVFIPDDLWLKNIFMVGADSPSFVWLPNGNLFSFINPRKLLSVYDALGVRKLSKSVKCSIPYRHSSDQSEKTDLKKKLIVKGLIEIILGFLACKIHMNKKGRHDAVLSLLNLLVFKNNGDIRILYQLHTAGDTCIQREVEKLVHWDKKSRKLFIDGSFCENHKASAKFVNFFAVEIAEGLLPQESVTAVNELRNLIHLGFLYEFEEQSIRFLLTRENIEVLPEDEVFLASALSSNDGQRLSKRIGSAVHDLAPLTPNASHHVKKRRLDEIVLNNETRLTSNSAPDVNKLLKKVAPKGEATKDSNMKPKRPKNSFVSFMEEFRKQYILEPNHNKEILASGSAKWRAMSCLVEYVKEESQSDDSDEDEVMD
ncbi:hypothetical protein KSS87_015168 [Heliosperma pusillum]|nr:hypothetical protein KSS87_015168 [Heliosperma pusillum]